MSHIYPVEYGIIQQDLFFTGYLYDINGKLLLVKQREGNETTISMKHLKPSTYILKVIQTKDRTDATYCVSIFKIIKK